MFALLLSAWALTPCSVVLAASQQPQSLSSDYRTQQQSELAPAISALAQKFDSKARKSGNRLAAVGWTVYENKKETASDINFKIRAGMANSLKNPRGGIVFLLDW